MNRAVEFEKYTAQILVENIGGRTEASRLERQFIDNYYLKHGRNPIGNLIPKRKLK
jgi:hypothetical protein